MCSTALGARARESDKTLVCEQSPRPGLFRHRENGAASSSVVLQTSALGGSPWGSPWVGGSSFVRQLQLCGAVEQTMTWCLLTTIT